MWFINNMTYDMAKHLSLLGVIVLVGFAYCYFGPVTEMELDLVDVKLEIAGTEQQLEDTSLTNAQKVNIIKSNIEKAEIVGTLEMSLLIYKIITGVFAFGGIVIMKLGFWRMYAAKKE